MTLAPCSLTGSGRATFTDAGRRTSCDLTAPLLGPQLRKPVPACGRQLADTDALLAIVGHRRGRVPPPDALSPIRGVVAGSRLVVRGGERHQPGQAVRVGGEASGG
ncbi:MAG: hypothetical protein GY856_14105 [bacterium]|nr:hypothetical protein [bacterium]